MSKLLAFPADSQTDSPEAQEASPALDNTLTPDEFLLQRWLALAEVALKNNAKPAPNSQPDERGAESPDPEI